MSGSGTTTAFSTGFAASMRAIALSASSAGVTSPSATRSRSATASSHPRSLAGTAAAYAIQHEHRIQPGDVQRRVFDEATFSRGSTSFRRGDVQRAATCAWIPWRGTTVCSTGLVPVMPRPRCA